MDLVLQECLYADHDDYEHRNEVVAGFNEARELALFWLVEYADDRHRLRKVVKSGVTVSKDELYRLSKLLQIPLAKIPAHLATLFAESSDGYLTSSQVQQLYDAVIVYLCSFGIRCCHYNEFMNYKSRAEEYCR